jgi:MFS family permease
MMAGALLFTVTFLACLVLRPFWPFFAVRFFQGTAFSFLDTSALALIVNVVPLAYRGQGLAIFLLAPTLALALAPSFGMFIINHLGFGHLFFTCAGFSLCAFFFSWRLRGQYRVRSEEASPSGSPSFLELKIIAPSATSLLYNFVWGALTAFVPLHAIESGVSNPGYFFSSVAVMIMVGRAGARIVDTYSKEKIILIFISTSMIAMILLSLSKTLPMFILVGLLWGTGSAFFYPASMAYALDYADSSGGPAIATYRALSDLGIALGPAVMGMIIPLTSYRTMFLCLALICLINLSYFQFFVRKRG